MIYNKTTIRTFMASVFALMLIGCADDVEEQGELTLLQLMPYSSSFTDASQQPNAATRTVASDYKKYSSTLDGIPKIAIYLADTNNNCSYKGDFTHHADDTWTSSVYSQANTQYYVYGYTPSGFAEASITSDNYSSGATLTLNNMPTITSSDVAVIVGVLKGETGDGDIFANASKNLEPGVYSYETSAAGEDNYMYLLLDHLYSRINLRFAVDKDYAELRKIKVKSVAMEIVDAPESVNAKITLKAGESPTMSPEMTFSSTKANTTSDTSGNNILPADGITLKTDPDYTDVNQYCAPGLSSLTFNLTTTYDVYDKAGTCIRQDCKAINKNITITNTAAGKSYNFNMTVTPTYLYQLSQPDLDFPTIVVSE